MADQSQEWQKALVLVLRKLGIVEILLTQADVDAINGIEEGERPCPVTFQSEDGIHIRLVTADEARELGSIGMNG